MIRSSLITLPLLLLAACGSGAEKADAPQKADAQAAAEGPRLEPGQWEMVSEIVSAELPGAPPEALRQVIGRKQTISHCLTAEEAARPQSEFFNRPQPEANCRQDGFSMANGRIQASMICAGNGSGEMRTQMEGRYEPTSYDITATIRMAAPANAGEAAGDGMKMSAHVVGRRTGECSSAPDAEPKTN